MARILKGSHSFTCTPTPRLSANRMNDTLPAFVFPAEASTHLPTQEGWKAEFALVAGWLHTEISVQHRELNKDKITHLSIRWR